MSEQSTDLVGFLLPKSPTPSATQTADTGGDPAEFVSQYLPLAEKISAKTGVAPNVILGQLGLETGWGKSVIPGTNNLGNIKDFSGGGVQATDNMTGSRDGYRRYASTEEFGDDFAGLLSRRYKGALGTAGNAGTYFTALKQGGYAEDPDYVAKGVGAANRVAGIIGRVRNTPAAAGGMDPAATQSAPRYASTQLRTTPERSGVEAATDALLSLGSGLSTGVGMVAGAFGADNAVARGAQDLSQSIDSKGSDRRAFQREQRAELIRQAEQSGDVGAEIKAYAGMFFDDPVGMTLNSLGTSAPSILAAMIPGLNGAGAARLIAAGVGSVQGAGSVKGSIYDDVRQRAIAAGVPAEEAEKIAAGAQAYAGPNRDNILAGAAIGAVAGSTGAEANAARLAAGQAQKAGGVVRATAAGAGKESATEFVQEGQEKLASNVAQQRAGYEQDAMQGVIGSGTLGALAAAPVGGAGGALEHTFAKPPVDPAMVGVEAEAAKPNSPLAKAAVQGNTPEVQAARVAAQEQAAAAQAGAVSADGGQAADPGAAPAPDAAARLAELEQIARGSEDDGSPARFFTEDEAAEYDRLKKLRDASKAVAEDGKPAADPIGDRARQLQQVLRDGGLQRLREQGEDAKGLLRDLAVAQSPSTNAAQREQAMARVEYAMDFAGMQMPEPAARAGAEQADAAPANADPLEAALRDPRVSAADRQALTAARGAAADPRLPQATRDQALAQAREIAGRYAAEPAAAPEQRQQGQAVTREIAPLPGTPEEAISQAERQEAGAFQLRAEGFDSEAAQHQAQADSLREEAATRREAAAEAARVEDVPAPRVATPPGPGAAAIRKRKATLAQLAEGGLSKVERRDDGFFMVSANGKRQFRLDSPADAQLARAAIAEQIRAGAERANTAPTQAQAEAGNYRKGRIEFDGLKLGIENPIGSTRSGTAPDGTTWSTTMTAHYGDVTGTKAADGDAVDVYVVDNPRPGSPVFVIDQYNEDGSFDETKSVLGVRTAAEAERVYDAHFSDGSGPRRRRATTEMTVDQFKAWANSSAARKPAGGKDGATGQADAGAGARGADRSGDAPAGMGVPGAQGAAADGRTPVDAAPADAGQRDGSVRQDGEPRANGSGGRPLVVRVDGKPVSLQMVPEDKLPERASTERGGQAVSISKARARTLSAVAAIFGKKVEFFSAEGMGVGDGFIIPSDTSTVYLNRATGISPLAVLGHELMHLLKRDVPSAHAAIEKVVAERLKDGALEKQQGLGYTADMALEEITSDLGGDLMADSTFWSEVMAKIQEAEGDRARGIIAQLAAFLRKALDSLTKGLRTYGAEDMVTDIAAIRAAMRDALAQYAAENSIRPAALQAESLRAEQDVKLSAPREVDQTKTEAFKRWFGDWEDPLAGSSKRSRDLPPISQAVNEDGTPKIYYHGTRGDFSKFETQRLSKNSDPLLGSWDVRRHGIFFADTPTHSEAFTTNNGGEGVQDGASLMPVYLRIHAPLDLTDGVREGVAEELAATGEVTERWAYNQLGDWSNFDDETGEAFVRALRAAGYDSVIFNDQNPDNGETVVSTVVLDPEQIKSAIGNRGTFDPADADITRSVDRTDTPAFKAWFKKSKVVDGDGKPMPVFHGTSADFTVFDHSTIDSINEGLGFYFTDNPAVAAGYGAAKTVYLSMQNPMAYDRKPFSKPELQKIIRRMAELQADAEDMDIGDGLLSNFGDVRSDGLQSVLNEAVRMTANEADANDQIASFFGAGVSPEYILRAVHEVTGIDGITANGFSNEGTADGTDDNHIFVAWFPEQIKSVDNIGSFDPSDADIMRSVDRDIDRVKAKAYERRTGFAPYLPEGQLDVEIEDIVQSVKREGKYGLHPVLGIPVNANGTVTLYFPTTNEDARRVVRERTLKGAEGAERIYLTNESSAPEVANNPGNIEQAMDGANVLLQIDPSLLQVDAEHPSGRKDFFVPLREGKAFFDKLRQVRLFTQNAPRQKALSADTKLTDIEREVSGAIADYLKEPPARRREMLRDARALLKKEHNVGTLLGVNGKLEKTNLQGYRLDNYTGQDVMSMGLGLASAQKINEKNLSTCPNSAICEGLCLGETSGQNLLYGGAGQFRSGPRLSQYLKTEALVLHPREFALALHAEIAAFERASKRDDVQPTVRLNVTSDFRPQTFKGIIDAFPGVMFYDYTKLPTKPIADNHHLTYSSTGASQIVNGQPVYNADSNWDRMVKVLQGGSNVAMAFTSRTAMPKFVADGKTGQRFQVWNGDLYDARFLDPKRPDGVGMVVGLTNKDRTTKPEDAAVRHRGFFVDYDTERDGDTVVIPDQEAMKPARTQPIQISRRSSAEPKEIISSKDRNDRLEEIEEKLRNDDPLTQEESEIFFLAQEEKRRAKYALSIEPKKRRDPVTKTPAFRAWFGNSKVVNPGGSPRVVYHGTNSDFTTFDPSRQGATAGVGGGYFFTSSEDVARDVYAWRDGSRVMGVYLSLQKPLGFDEYFRRSGKSKSKETRGGEMAPVNYFDEHSETILGFAKANGYDGIMWPADADSDLKHDLIVAFDQGQIKSANQNSGAFDRNNPDITRSVARGEPSYRKPATEAFRTWFGRSKVPRVVYHATNADFDAFDTTRSDMGAHFGTLEQANRVSSSRLAGTPQGGTNIIPAWLSIQNPLRLKDVGTFHADGIADQLERKGLLPKGEGKRIVREIDANWRKRADYDPVVRQAIIDAGYDGVVYSNTQEGDGDSYIIFEPTQAKSATGNSGAFDRTNPDIIRSADRGEADDAPSYNRRIDLVRDLIACLSN